MANFTGIPRLGLIGCGAFGRLAGAHLARHVPVLIHDPDPGIAVPPGCTKSNLDAVARCDIVVLAMPVPALEACCKAIAPRLRPGALVLDVCSVKIGPARIMEETMPAHVDIVATHPLFGPQSATTGLAGHQIALCPVRGDRHREVAAFLRARLNLHVHVTTPEAHDRDMALVQGVTHLIARVLDGMGPLPRGMTTRSYDMLCAATDMVRDDAPEVFAAIEAGNPHAAAMRHRFFEVAETLRDSLEGTAFRVPASEALRPLRAHPPGRARIVPSSC